MREIWISEVSRRAEPLLRSLAFHSRWSDLERACEHVLEVDPESQVALEYSLRAAWAQFKYDDVSLRAQSLLRVDPHEAGAWLWLARVSMVRGQGLAAQHALLQARARADHPSLHRRIELMHSALVENQRKLIAALRDSDPQFESDFIQSAGQACHARGLLYSE